MTKTIFLYSGEGTKNKDSHYRLVKSSRYWNEIDQVIKSKWDLELKTIWDEEISSHTCPKSPLLTVINQICLTDIWTQWGFEPDVFIGHSIGELTAAHQAGLYSLEEILSITYEIGQVTSKLTGKMIHGYLDESKIDQLNINLSSINFGDESKKHVTLSDYKKKIDIFLNENSDFVELKLPHPWHHPDYKNYFNVIEDKKSRTIPDHRFVSGITTDFETDLKNDHWRNWCTNRVDFIATLETVKKEYKDHHLQIIEIGFHPVLEKCCEVFKDYEYVSSMFRGEDEIQWILNQRKKLDPDKLIRKLKSVLSEFKDNLDFSIPLSYQGFDSLAFVKLTSLLGKYFPSIAPQDFYRYKTLNNLINEFGNITAVSLNARRGSSRNQVVIAGMSCKFPSSAENINQFWETLISREDQVRADSSRGDYEAGFLDRTITKFDHKYFNISDAEARTMDPQQILALELTELLWLDAGIDHELLDKNRVGVYLGAWNQEYAGQKDSVYYPSGVNPSIIASRISHFYDLRGPSWITNTACSSSLVALHYAAKDIEAGRIDFAVTGGVNLLLGNDFTHSMKNSGFLSEDSRCKTFDNSANGYVRSEGGGLVLLANKDFVDTYYSEILGSFVNQNGARSQTMNAPHPGAQEELIFNACRDAGIGPRDIAYLECHGTGTKIGDPIEISAIQRSVAKNRETTCYLGSVKSNIGHLESAAGVAGLIKSALILNKGIIPPDLHFEHPNQHIDFESHNLKVVTQETKIENTANIGISSFGFGGVNVHVVIKGADGSVRKKVNHIEIPFDREKSRSLTEYFKISKNDNAFLNENESLADNHFPAPDNNDSKTGISADYIQKLFYDITAIEEIDPEIELIEQGLDSIGALEFVTSIQEAYGIELDPDFLFEYPLMDQMIEQINEMIMVRTEHNL